MAALFLKQMRLNEIWVKGWSKAALLISATSMAEFVWIFGISTPALLRAPGANLVGSLTFSGFGYSEVEKKLWDLAHQCGIERDGKYNRLGVDALTYWAFRRSEEPIDIFYLSLSYGNDLKEYRKSIGSLETFLKARGSDGIVARCEQVIEPEMRARAKQLGQFCCWKFNENTRR
jgi:hypothetical protein